MLKMNLPTDKQPTIMDPNWLRSIRIPFSDLFK